MIELIAHNLAPIMFISVMASLLLGYPVAFTLAAGGLGFFVIGVALSDFSPSIQLSFALLQSHPDRIYGNIMSNETLLAIPFFTFMGIILERSRMAEDLLDTIGQLFGPVRGGLAYAAVLVGALLGATTGVVAASVMAMGLISMPIMLRYGYNRPFVSGTIAASGTLAQIVPPSLVLIVMADQLGRSVGDMYVGALYPALLIVAAYCLYVFVITMVRPKWAPALPREARTLGGGVTSLIAMIALAGAIYYLSDHFLFSSITSEWREVGALTAGVSVIYVIALANDWMKLNLISRLAQQVIIVMIPPLALIFLVLGTIFLGIATPTEGGAMGAAGALIMSFAKRRLTFDVLKQAVEATTKLSAFVMMILIGARVFGLTFYGIEGNKWIEELLLSLPGGEYGFLIVVTIIVFILGCFLDFFEIAFIIIPLLAPVAEAHGIDLIWFGIILGINLQTSFLTPPFGFSLFYLRSIAPSGPWKDEATGRTLDGVSTMQIYRGVVPYIIIQFLMVMVVIAFPQLVMVYKGDKAPVNLNDVQINVPMTDEGGGIPGLNLPPVGTLGGGNDSGNALGLPPLTTLPGQSQPKPDEKKEDGGIDLSKPPVFN
ncbi:TRAP transporter large permease subunit [Rhizobium sp. L1K21]|uniref:TRAP transporter large permease n=1 Tax=Rhizobium sp. L1K21 TaxID=2954933 RepID=UPI0020936EB2|nr:TRAP transporter large permease subunit [Rhizobium sp. L1K21]MCO6184998.1 TRAP transporter large permease subunit [Rhizobium sp. L1K21]